MNEMADSNEVIDIKDMLAKFTTDVIGSCAFGIECNSFETADSDFRKYGKSVFEENAFKALKMMLAFNYENLAKKLRITILDKDVENFFVKISTETYNYRVRNNIKRVWIFVAGFDTSAATLTFCLLELACNYDIQDKLREEIFDVLYEYNGEITYEALHEMKYMDQVINETLRKYPVVSMILRKCTQDYQVPFSNSVIEKGTFTIISAMGLHRDPEYFPNPEKFYPDRFSDANLSKIRAGSYLPFGDGPRICIGMRFGMMQVKICLITLLKNFEFSLNSQTKMPPELDFGFITTAKGGVWLNCQKLNKDLLQ
ncbi:cytochrome p450 [Holotrichia oblita]|uniref:Cytochrome p450 n=1 Tax=Holotrichia oblita TaxID=644536 RepID=A0ACB9SQN0_HOLOL|nr:cytochrome p450 [Holotrichia oblita]